MRTRRKKRIRVPITSADDNDGAGMRAAFFVIVVLIAGGLLYTYTTRPDLFAQLANIEVGKTNTIAPPPHL
jgi:hypothetical protein